MSGVILGQGHQSPYTWLVRVVNAIKWLCFGLLVVGCGTNVSLPMLIYI